MRGGGVEEYQVQPVRYPGSVVVVVGLTQVHWRRECYMTDFVAAGQRSDFALPWPVTKDLGGFFQS